MYWLCLTLILEQINMNYKFKRSFTCTKFQINCQMHSLIQKKITKHVFILVGNTPTRIDVPIGRLCNVKANESKSCLKGGRLVSSKYTIP